MYNIVYKRMFYVIILVLILSHYTLDFCLKKSRNNVRGIT
jgi:hypothetical protein